MSTLKKHISPTTLTSDNSRAVLHADVTIQQITYLWLYTDVSNN